MKQKIIVLLLALIASGAMSQNVQLHYDLGKDRKYLTSTVEMFRPDKWGSTFFFIDMDYNVGEVKGVCLAYFEIAREINLGKSPFAFHAEYNGGFGQFQIGSDQYAYQINDAWLGGVDYIWNNSDFTRGFTFQALYKYIRGKHDAAFQLTGVWYMHLLDKKFTFSGFADFWREDNVFIKGESVKKTKFIFLTEPQFWYNITSNISVGSEIELGSNFGTAEGFVVNPTVAAKWTF